VKNNFFFLILLIIIGCSPQPVVYEKISCPEVLYSEEHDQFVSFKGEEIDLNKVSYIAQINNYAFDSDCLINKEKAYVDLSLLFVVKPGYLEDSNIFLPFYIATINNQNEIIDMQYYNTNGNFNIDDVTKIFVETELREKIRIKLVYKYIEEIPSNTLVIGFMLNKKQLEILN
tara:strand:+ start:37 stop:555 length:519 start_codon:yes stop_codon:yes gene_type:complete